MAISLPEETRKAFVAAIKHYFKKERNEEIGELAADFFLDFVLEQIGPSIYNQAIRDVQASLQTTIAELDVNLGEPEAVW